MTLRHRSTSLSQRCSSSPRLDARVPPRPRAACRRCTGISRADHVASSGESPRCRFKSGCTGIHRGDPVASYITNGRIAECDKSCTGIHRGDPVASLCQIWHKVGRASGLHWHQPRRSRCEGTRRRWYPAEYPLQARARRCHAHHGRSRSNAPGAIERSRKRACRGRCRPTAARAVPRRSGPPMPRGCGPTGCARQGRQCRIMGQGGRGRSRRGARSSLLVAQGRRTGARMPRLTDRVQWYA